MAKKKIRVTESYDIVTEESSQDGDFAESGWNDEEGREFDSAREAAKHICDEGGIEPSSSQFHKGVWYNTEEEMDRNSGDSTTRAFHVKGASEAQQKAIYKHVVQDRCNFNK